MEKKNEKPALEKIGFGQILFSLYRKNTLDDRAISSDWQCHGRALLTNEAGLQFILSCDYLIVQNHVKPLFEEDMS